MPHATTDDTLLRRILGDFREMPGLRVTAAQAQRLWALDTGTCETLLSRLVEQRLLQRTSDGRAYAVTSSR
jgi:DNA-binding IclR family transcriptional regulator